MIFKINAIGVGHSHYPNSKWLLYDYIIRASNISVFNIILFALGRQVLPDGEGFLVLSLFTSRSTLVGGRRCHFDRNRMPLDLPALLPRWNAALRWLRACSVSGGRVSSGWLLAKVLAFSAHWSQIKHTEMEFWGNRMVALILSHGAGSTVGSASRTVHPPPPPWGI